MTDSRHEMQQMPLSFICYIAFYGINVYLFTCKNVCVAFVSCVYQNDSGKCKQTNRLTNKMEKEKTKKKISNRCLLAMIE